MDGAAVGDALVLEVEHLLPYPIPIHMVSLLQTPLLEHAPLQLAKKLLHGQCLRRLHVLLVVLRSLAEQGVALARQQVHAFLEARIAQRVVLDLLQKLHERLLEVAPAFLHVDEGSADHDSLILLNGLLRNHPYVSADPLQLNFGREVLPQRAGAVDNGGPVEKPTLLGQHFGVLLVQQFVLGLADESGYLDEQWGYLFELV